MADFKNVKDINTALENVKESDLHDVNKVKILKETSENLFDILGNDELIADVKDHESDLAKSAELLAKRKDLVAQEKIDDEVLDTLDGVYETCQAKNNVKGDNVAETSEVARFEKLIKRKL